jgi:hypothetical protein
MRLARILVSGLLCSAMLCVGVEGTQLSLGTPAYAKRHHRKKHHRKHARRRNKHARAGSSTPEL